MRSGVQQIRSKGKEEIGNKLYHYLFDDTNWESFPWAQTFAFIAFFLTDKIEPRQEIGITFNGGASWSLALPKFRLASSSFRRPDVE